MLPTFPTAHVFQTDPDLWLPPYEPPQDFVCIADPPGNYGNVSIKTLTGQESKKPAPKPEPSPKPPQPRDGYDVETDLTDMLPNTEGNDIRMLGGTGPKKPEPKPKPPQPRDGYERSFGPAAMIRRILGKGAWKQPNPKPEPKPKPPQPRDGYRNRPSPTAWILGGSDLKPLQPVDGYQVEVRTLVSPVDDTTPIFSWFNDRYQNKAWVI